MDTDNLQYLQSYLRHTGFGEKLNAELEKQAKTGVPVFTLRTSGYYMRPDSKKDDLSTRDKVDYELQFKKGKDSERYFFNSYSASLDKNGQTAEHKFYIDKGAGMTRKEAYNLLDGRAVYKELKTKEGQSYNAWLKLDPEKKDAKKPFLSYGEGYGYDVMKALGKHPVKELGDMAARAKVMEGLLKGNLVPVTYVKGGNEEEMVAAANPQFKAVDLYGMDGKKVFVENERKAGEGVADTNGQKVEGVEKAGVDAKVESETKQGRKR